MKICDAEEVEMAMRSITVVVVRKKWTKPEETIMQKYSTTPSSIY